MMIGDYLKNRDEKILHSEEKEGLEILECENAEHNGNFFKKNEDSLSDLMKELYRGEKGIEIENYSDIIKLQKMFQIEIPEDVYYFKFNEGEVEFLDTPYCGVELIGSEFLIETEYKK